MKEILTEWKEIASTLMVPYGTARRWHNDYLKIPFIKSANSQTGRVLITKSSLKKWSEVLFDLYPALKRNVKH
jgi:hypothetical protein